MLALFWLLIYARAAWKPVFYTIGIIGGVPKKTWELLLTFVELGYYLLPSLLIGFRDGVYEHFSVGVAL